MPRTPVRLIVLFAKPVISARMSPVPSVERIARESPGESGCLVSSTMWAGLSGSLDQSIFCCAARSSSRIAGAAKTSEPLLTIVPTVSSPLRAASHTQRGMRPRMKESWPPICRRQRAGMPVSSMRASPSWSVMRTSPLPSIGRMKGSQARSKLLKSQTR